MIGYVSLPGRGATDAFLAEVVGLLRGRKVALAGTVQTNLARSKSHPCDMDLQVLPDGPVFRISQDLGAGSRGCRLNSGVMEEAVMAASLRLDGASALIVNKFGKLEAEGRGFVPVIVRAIERELPVLVGVNGLNLPSFLAFASGLAVELPTTVTDVVGWLVDRMEPAEACAG